MKIANISSVNIWRRKSAKRGWSYQRRNENGEMKWKLKMKQQSKISAEKAKRRMKIIMYNNAESAGENKAGWNTA